MLIKCEECGLQVSDKAAACPHCGCPVNINAKTNITRKSNKRRRLPNGFGQITEIKGRILRNPFRAMITVGKDENGRPISKPLKPESYFPTYNDAYAALINYHKNPYDIDDSITVMELYERWTDEHFKTLKGDSNIRAIKSAWSYCSSIYSMKAVDLRARHIKGCMEHGTAIVKGKEKTTSPNIKARIKSTFNTMLDYAVEYEIVDKNYARTFSIPEDVKIESEKNRKPHIPFTDEEINELWEHAYDMYYVGALLIQCYSGWRPQEIGLLKLENINLDNWTIIGGMKTKAGNDRIVPIHSRIQPLVEQKYKHAESIGSKYLINCIDPRSPKDGIMLKYERYHTRFDNIIADFNFNPEHRPHDGRMHFVTSAKSCGVDEYAIKYIVGHAINDITEKIYTKRNIDWLREEIEKIK